MIQIEVLMGMLEAANCGSVGGFDHYKGVSQQDSDTSLDNRYIWLLHRAWDEFAFKVARQTLVNYNKVTKATNRQGSRSK